MKSGELFIMVSGANPTVNLNIEFELVSAA
jgi:hypothetical protein